MAPERFPVRVKNGAGPGNLYHTACLRCCGSCPNAHQLWLLHLFLVPGIAVNKPAIIVLRDEANFLAFSLTCYAHAAFRRHCPHLRLGVFAQGKAGVSKLLLVEYVQHIRLILFWIDASPQSALACYRMVIYTHIVTRCQVIGIKRQGAIEQQGEADMAVAGQARVGCAARHVFLGEEVDHVFLEFLLHVDQVKWYIKHTRHAPCIIDGFKGAALILRYSLHALRLDDARLRPEAQHDSDHLVSLLLEQSGGYRTIHAAAHCDDYPCHDDAPMLVCDTFPDSYREK